MFVRKQIIITHVEEDSISACKNQNKCHSEPISQRLTREESQKSEILRKQFQRRCSQNDTALVGADSISAHQRGITLIALVVTLVVLLILAGVTINIMLSEGGIIAKAQSSKEKQKIAVWLDRLTVAEANTAVNYLAVDLGKYNEQLKKEGIANEDNYTTEDEGETYNLTTDNSYVFNISEPTKGDIVINYIGKNGQLVPYIKEIKVINTTTNSSKIEVEVVRLEDGGKLSYYYKKSSETEYKALKENTTDKTAEFTGLTQNETYDLKLVATNKNGSVEQKISVVTGELLSGTISQKGPTVWSNNQAGIELQTTDTTNTMQYQKNGIVGTWTNYGAAITGLVHGDIIYARMFDGINGSSPYSLNITDTVTPQTATINLSKTTTEPNTAITAIVTQIDNESGINIIKCKWVYNTIPTEIGTNEESYTGGTFNTNPQMINLNTSTVGTYYIHVLTIDKAGNKKETVSSAVEIKQLATGISLNQTSGVMYTEDSLTLTATIIPSNTSNKNVTWTSSNTAVATVINGIVTAKSGGTTTITVTTQDGSNKTATCNLTVKQLAITDIKAGDWISYSGGGYSSWRVLWEANNSTAGNGKSIQIISTESVKNVTLGSTNSIISKSSYNNAIVTLNNEANAYINSTYANNARCVGSVPNDKNSESGDMPNSYEYLVKWGPLKDKDRNYEKDYKQMSTLNIQNISTSKYWLASRRMESDINRTYAYVYNIEATTLHYSNLYFTYPEGPYGYAVTHGFRPVVSLKSTIKVTGGNGTQVSPWQISI